MNKGLRVVGIDLSEKMIEIAKREVPTGTFSVLDLADINTLKYEFDGIFMQAVLLHIPKKEIAADLKKISKKLKNGGYLYVAVKGMRPGGLEEEVKIENDYGYNYQRFFSYFTSEEIENHFRHCGLKIIFSEVDTCGKTNWIQIIGKKVS